MKPKSTDEEPESVPLGIVETDSTDDFGTLTPLVKNEDHRDPGWFSGARERFGV